ncbi:MAG: GNAT family N-acetyltransferase [Terrimonas sp.]|nr:GNAT family N-acetyltransferase [Terrimonas sp.]
MAVTQPIRFLSRHQIDKAKWDRCLSLAENGLLYGYSYYLDHMCKHWSGLVLNDYESVMPVTWHKKYGIYYLYQPPFCAQLGVFGNHIDANKMSEFLGNIPGRFRYWDIYLNPGNPLHETEGSYLRKNFSLRLNLSYESLINRFSDNIKRNIRKAVAYGSESKRNLPLEEVMRFIKKHPHADSSIRESDFDRFEKLFQFLHARGQALSYGILNGEEKLIAAAIFFFCGQRAYYILAANAQEGKDTGASQLLMQHFIKDHAGKEMVLDFEGSDHPGLAHFYSSFGAREEQYPCIRRNNLPWYIRWLKQ